MMVANAGFAPAQSRVAPQGARWPAGKSLVPSLPEGATMTAQTLYDKLWHSHVVHEEADGTVLLTSTATWCTK